eukprot:211317-Chlamydomonas_euryale.AAC.1
MEGWTCTFAWQGFGLRDTRARLPGKTVQGSEHVLAAHALAAHALAAHALAAHALARHGGAHPFPCLPLSQHVFKQLKRHRLSRHQQSDPAGAWRRVGRLASTLIAQTNGWRAGTSSDRSDMAWPSSVHDTRAVQRMLAAPV